MLIIIVFIIVGVGRFQIFLKIAETTKEVHHVKIFICLILGD